MIAASENNHFW